MAGLVDTYGWEIEAYAPVHREEWDAFALAARNSVFLFRRGYMDYHSDRFRDRSLMARRRGRLLALLPANLTDDGVLHSHSGLTYGGWILPEKHLDAEDVLSLFHAAAAYCRNHGIKAVDYKPLPWIYARRPSQEDLYALYRLGATPSGAQVSSTIDYRDPGTFNTLMRRHLRKADALGPVIGETGDVPAFHRLLKECLRERHAVAPVHSLAELTLLRDRFPQNIRLFTASLDGEPQAGVCMYLTDTVAHAQYIATTPRGRKLNLLTPLFHHLIELYSATHRYFDFGTSNEEGGLVLNAGLLRQKSSYGATATIYSRYLLTL